LAAAVVADVAEADVAEGVARLAPTKTTRAAAYAAEVEL